VLILLARRVSGVWEARGSHPDQDRHQAPASAPPHPPVPTVRRERLVSAVTGFGRQHSLGKGAHHSRARYIAPLRNAASLRSPCLGDGASATDFLLRSPLIAPQKTFYEPPPSQYTGTNIEPRVYFH